VKATTEWAIAPSGARQKIPHSFSLHWHCRQLRFDQCIAYRLKLSRHNTFLRAAHLLPSLAHLAQAYLVLGLNTVCDVYFAGSIDLLCDAWNLTPDVAGVTWPEHA